MAPELSCPIGAEKLSRTYERARARYKALRLPISALEKTIKGLYEKTGTEAGICGVSVSVVSDKLVTRAQRKLSNTPTNLKP